MKAATGVFALVMSLVLAAMPAAAANKVFLLAGQSNMQGVGVAADLPAPYNAPQSNVKFWNNGWVDLRGGFGYASGYFGPEVTFGYTLAHTVFPNDNIYLVKCASGGSALADQAKRWTTKGSGVCYNTFTSTVNAAMRNLRDAGLSPAIVGMIWMQGESDAVNHTYAAAYAANMTTFIAAVRSDFATPAMQFVAGRIMNYSSYPFGTPVDNALVRRALATVPGQVGHASWIDTDDLKVWPHGGNHEGHYSTQGQIDLGVRFAKQFAQRPSPPRLCCWIRG